MTQPASDELIAEWEDRHCMTTIETRLIARIRQDAETIKRMDDARSVPDYCYNVDDWEWTSTWNDRYQVIDDLPLGGVMRVGTLFRGPDKWAAHLPITWDEDGDPDETKIQWFDTEEAARAARSSQDEIRKEPS